MTKSDRPVEFVEERLAWEQIAAGNFRAARDMLEPLAARGSEYALLTLGAFHENGRLGVPRADLALIYYERAASLGSAEASRRVGHLMLDLGDSVKAWSAFENGAAEGNVSCMYWLGQLALDGRCVNVDADRGVEWLKAAAKQGHVYAKRRLLEFDLFKSRSPFARLRIRLQIAALAREIAKEVWRDRESDLTR